jgi:ATP-dependent Clp protease ATP-binding subunit ClpA
MDHASLTDNNGKKADFRNVILIMTSNVGARGMSVKPIGFGDASPKHPRQAVEKVFSPEFRNRLDATITFNPLGDVTMAKIVDKFLDELQERLVEKSVTLTVSDKARKHIAKNGFDPVFGARPLGRYIQTVISDLIASEILFGKLKKGGKIDICLQKGELVFDFSTGD